MLKAKTKTRSFKGKSEAMKALMRDDHSKAIYTQITQKQYKKLNIHLANEDISLAFWIRNKIDEI